MRPLSGSAGTIASVSSFELGGLDPLRARSLIPFGIYQPVNCDDHAPRHQAARDCERDHKQSDITPGEDIEHASPRGNPGRITVNRRLGSSAGYVSGLDIDLFGERGGTRTRDPMIKSFLRRCYCNLIRPTKPGNIGQVSHPVIGSPTLFHLRCNLIAI